MMTKKMERARWGLFQRAEKALKQDAELAQVARELSTLWNKAYVALREKELVKARAADAGEICWTVFVPTEGHHVKAYCRSPNRAWVEHFYSWGGGRSVTGEELAHTDAWLHLARVKEMAAVECVRPKEQAAA